LSSQYSGEAFKRSIVRYAVGRILNAGLAFAIFVWIARQLPAAEYASYVAAFALVEVGLVVAGFGMEWVTAVYVPQVRLQASGRKLWQFISECAGIQAITLLLGATVLFAAAPHFGELLGLTGAGGAIRMYAVVMFVEGVSRVLRDQLLSCLLLQGAAQVSQLARNCALLGAAVWLFADEQRRTAQYLAIAEICASAVSLLIAAGFLTRYLFLARNDPVTSPDWEFPRWPQLLRVARNAWLSNLANLTWGWSVVVLLVTRTLGADATAALGFARNFVEQIRRFMPMEFLFGIMRTLVIARYTRDGDLHSLGLKIGLMYKANLIFVLPLLVACLVLGDQIAIALTDGRYSEAHWYLVGWLLVLIPLAHHRLTDLLAHALHRSELTARASLYLAFTPIAVVSSAYVGKLFLLFAVLIAAETIYSGIVVRGVKVPGWKYVLDWRGLAKMFAGAVVAGTVLSFIPVSASLAVVGSVVCLAFVLVWSVAWLLGVMGPEERKVLPEKARHWLSRGSGV